MLGIVIGWGSHKQAISKGKTDYCFFIIFVVHFLNLESATFLCLFSFNSTVVQVNLYESKRFFLNLEFALAPMSQGFHFSFSEGGGGQPPLQE